MLVSFVALYLLVTVAIGWYAAQRVKTASDYFVAGRSLPLYMNMATVFATWFGAETVLAVSSTFLRDGLGGIAADPFGASACLIIVALVFARLFYRLNLLPIGVFYKRRYNRTVEIGTGERVGAPRVDADGSTRGRRDAGAGRRTATAAGHHLHGRRGWSQPVPGAADHFHHAVGVAADRLGLCFLSKPLAEGERPAGPWIGGRCRGPWRVAATISLGG